MIKFAIVYNSRNKKLRKDGTASVQIRAYLNKKRKYFATGIYVTPSQWCARNNKIVNHSNHFQYNAEIRRQLDELEAYALEWIKKHGSMTLEQLESYFKYEDVQSFTEFWKYELENDTKLTKITKKKHKTAFNYWVAYQKDVKFSELTYNLIHGFDTFLYAHKLHTNTVYTHHKQVKKYINQAIRRDLFDANKNPYLKFTPSTAPTERTVLSTDEVQRLEALTFKQDEFYLELIRDMFLFSCYTGLRFSDTCAVRHKDIDQDKEGLILNIVAKKTSKQLLLPLYKLHKRKPEALIYKYRIIQEGAEEEPIFHKYTNQYFNRTLKELAALACIPKEITSHVGRHTFATHLASKVPIHILKAILQHSKIETTMGYLHLSNKLVNDALDGVDW
ncbi:site-specific integrase [Aureispira anguillae]|uniref:Site-specific integrase n=1 Tax=Aureispira anguillae TaxID=2864201 RepID=A0A916DQS6_9BACT|nr:site-specific integrase [Aureispira anguillae]BDS10881.1 site-specific integrase [Aureispira anguillae]